MRKVKMLVSMAGPDESWQPGDTREVADNIAEAWEKADIAMIMPEGPIVFEKSKKAARGKK